jgi:hypothetical protein
MPQKTHCRLSPLNIRKQMSLGAFLKEAAFYTGSTALKGQHIDRHNVSSILPTMTAS